MNVLLWILQGLLALHTLIGALWKLSNSAQTVPSLHAIPHMAWLALSALEIMCSVALIVPALKQSLARIAAIAALFIAAEMLLFVGLHLGSHETAGGQVHYWLTVAAVSSFIAYGRLRSRCLTQISG